MTTVDLWRIVNPLSKLNSSEQARKLEVEIGFLNQQAIASSIGVGLSGSDVGHKYRPIALARNNDSETAPLDYRDDADLHLDAPALDLIASLTPMDINALRKIAERTIFSIRVDPSSTDDAVRTQVSEVMKDYWREVCRYIGTHYSNQTRRLRIVKVFAFVNRNIPTFKKWYKRSDFLRDSVEMAGRLILNQDPTGSAKAGESIIRRATISLLYTGTDKYNSIRKPKSSLWTPKVLWSNFEETSEGGATSSAIRT